MAALYDKNHRYTPMAEILESRVNDAIKPIFDDMVKNGFSPREISHIIKQAVCDIELTVVLASPADDYTESCDECGANIPAHTSIFNLSHNDTCSLNPKNTVG